MANGNQTETTAIGVEGRYQRLPILPEINDGDEREETLEELLGPDPDFVAILEADPVLSKEETLREACRELVENKFQNLGEIYQFRPFFREEYTSTTSYDAALQDVSKELKQTFKELRDNAEDAATRKIFDGYYRTAHLLLKNRAAKAEYKEEQRLLDVLNATDAERGEVANVRSTAEKAVYFNIFFSDRVAEIVKESKEASVGKSQFEERVYALADAMRPVGIQREAKSKYHEAARIAVEAIGDKLTEAQQRRTEAASIALAEKYAAVPAFERKRGTKKQTGTEEGTQPLYAIAPFYYNVQKLVTEHEGSRNALKRKAYELLGDEYKAGADEKAMASYRTHVRYVLDNIKAVQSSGLKAVPDVSAKDLDNIKAVPDVFAEDSDAMNYAAMQAEEDAEVVEFLPGRVAEPVQARIIVPDVDPSVDVDLTYVQETLAQVRAQGAAKRETRSLKDYVRAAIDEVRAQGAAKRETREDPFDVAFFESYDVTTARFPEPDKGLEIRVAEPYTPTERPIRLREVKEVKYRPTPWYVQAAKGIAAIGAVAGAAVAGIYGMVSMLAGFSDNVKNYIESGMDQQQRAEVREESREEGYQGIEVQVEKEVKRYKAKRPTANTLETRAAEEQGNTATTYKPAEDHPMKLKKGSYTTEDRTITLTPIEVDWTPVIPDVKIKIEPRHADDIYSRVFEMAASEGNQEPVSEHYQPKPRRARYDLGVPMKLPEYKPLDLRVDTEIRGSRDYSLKFPPEQKAAPEKIVLFTF
jgi:hypothetical protein